MRHTNQTAARHAPDPAPCSWHVFYNARTRAQVIAAMIESADIEDLGLTGFGPEVSIYHAALKRTGIHRRENGAFGLHPPTDAGIKSVWDAIEKFCLEAQDAPRALDALYDALQLPPYAQRRDRLGATLG